MAQEHDQDPGASLAETFGAAFGAAFVTEATPTAGTAAAPVAEAVRPPGQPPMGTSEDDMALFFESPEDAQALYDFITGAETGIALLAPGEVLLVNEAQMGQYSLVFSGTTVLLKGEILAAIIEAYEDYFGADEVDEALAYLDELGTDLVEVNPYHDTTGRFASQAKLKRQKAGSYALGKRKNKVSAKGKKALKLVATKLPCGRAARKQDKGTRCFDGKNPNWWVGSAVSRLVRKVKTKIRGEALRVNAHDRMMLERVVAHYKRNEQ